MRQIDLIILHCTASDNPDQDNIAAISNLHTSKSDEPIKWGNYETHGKGWRDIGYHYVITKDFKVHYGRPIHEAGAHCYGYNANSIGIVVSGDTEFTQGQFETLRLLCHDLILQSGLENKDILLHNELNPNKTCPNFSRGKIWT